MSNPENFENEYHEPQNENMNSNPNMNPNMNMNPNPNMAPKPINQTPYLVCAILATVLCCIPLGIPAIIYASQISGAQAQGNYAAAANSAKKAKMFTIISAVAAVVVIVLYFVLVFVGVTAGFSGFSGSYSYY